MALFGTGVTSDLTQSASFIDNNDGTPGPLFTEYDGVTVTLYANITGLTAGVVYHFKMAIGDIGDGSWDSGVWVGGIQALDTGGLPISCGTDTDGDGVPDFSEAADGTDPNDLCSFVYSSQFLTPSGAWNNTDCDGDGVTNGTEVADGTDPTDICSFVFASVTLAQDPSWSALDCDGDGVTNGTEVTDGTDPASACSFVAANITLPATGDCDGDGVTNQQETIDGTDLTDACNRLTASITLPVIPDADGDNIPDACEPTPIGCDPLFYQVLTDQLNQFIPSTATYLPVGTPTGFQYNGLGYNEADGMMYAIAVGAGNDVLGNPIVKNDLVLIDGAGRAYYVATTTLPLYSVSYSAGDVRNGALVCRANANGGEVHSVDLVTGVATLLGNGFGAADGAFIGDVFYGVHNGQLYAFDLATNTASSTAVNLCSGGAMPSGGYGAAFIANNDELYVSNNGTGEIYRISDYSTGTPCGTLVANGSFYISK